MPRSHLALAGIQRLLAQEAPHQSTCPLSAPAPLTYSTLHPPEHGLLCARVLLCARALLCASLFLLQQRGLWLMWLLPVQLLCPRLQPVQDLRCQPQTSDGSSQSSSLAMSGDTSHTPSAHFSVHPLQE